MSDDALLNEFADAGSESAFAALVRRHANLVYATAQRQVGDASLAEEITQNVFLALARKSATLRRAKTISGWLYRTTLLEARQALRAELRRQRRESVAGELHQIARDGQSPWATIVPFLDEALTGLRERDRIAVLLRFFENKPFREIGLALGISEDAAQKRVTSSLAKLTTFFQRRGFALSGMGAGAGALFAEASAAAPAYLVARATQAGLAGGGASKFLTAGWIAGKLMNLTKPQAATASALTIGIMALPLAFEMQAQQHADATRANLRSRLALAQSSAVEIEARRDAAAQKLAGMRDLLSTPVGLAGPQRDFANPADAVWNDSSPLARVPKEMLGRLRINAVDQDWKIQPAIVSVLSLSPEQATQLQQSVDAYLSEISALEEAHLERLPPGPAQRPGGADPAAEPIHFRIHRYEPEANATRVHLREQLRSFLGIERAELAVRYLDLAPVDRPLPAPGEPPPEGDYFELSGHSSQRWNFQGYERGITLEPPAQIGLPPGLSIQVTFGQDSMQFGGDRHLLNPATAPSLRTEWDRLAAWAAPKSGPTR